jgi:hypothetical protein
MKKITMLCMMALLLTFIATATGAYAQEVVLESEVTNMTIQNDKNGNEYVRFIIKETRTLNGIDYETEVVTMAFGGTVVAAKELKTGDTLKAIAKVGEYNGDKNYRVLQFLK